MSKTKVVLEFFLPTTSLSRINDVVEPVRKTIEAARGQDFFMTYSGPFPDDTRGDNATSGNSEHGSGGRGDDGGGRSGRGDVGRTGDGGRAEAAARAREEFADDETGERGDSEGAEPPKRRGRPPGSGKRGAEASGTASGKSGRGSDAEGSRGSGEGSKRNEPRGADEGSGEGRAEGEGRARSAGRDRDAERGNSGEARVKAPAAQDWDDEGPDNNTEEGADWWAKTPGDEWPDHLMPKTIDKAAVGEALSKHFEQTTDRPKTLAVLKEATGESSLANVHPDDYDKAIRALLKDAARIEYGVKR